jgi:hypothetical protein
MLKESMLQLVRGSVTGLKRPVRLVLFTSDVNCDECSRVHELANAIKAASPKVALEHYDLTMDRDKSLEYSVQRVPSLVVQGQGVRAVSFSGLVEGVSLMLLLDAISGIANERPWFPGSVQTTLGMLEKPVTIRVILDNECTLCRPVAETAVGLALSNRLVSAEIIVADDYPELLAKHKVRILPYTLFGEKLHLEGHVSEGTFLEMIFQAAGKGAETDKRCMVCGSPSGEIICTGCKTRIQAEAVNHKRRDEKSSERGSAVETKHHH